MRKRLFVTLGLLFVLALLVYLPSVRRRAREARIERARVFRGTGNPAAFEKQLLELGCSSVVWVPLEESLSRNEPSAFVSARVRGLVTRFPELEEKGGASTSRPTPRTLANARTHGKMRAHPLLTTSSGRRRWMVTG